MDNTLLSYIYYQTRIFQNESEDEIVYQMIKAFLVADGTYIVPIQPKEKQLSKEMERLPPGIYSQLLSLFTNVPSIDGRIDEYNMVKKILLSSGDHTFGDGHVSNDPYPLIGFNNSGVTCYFNSLLQSILSLQTLRPYIEKYQLIQNYSTHYPAELLKQVQAHNHIAYSGQESASEYFLLLIEYWSKRASTLALSGGTSGEGELNSIFQYTHTYDRKCTNCGLASSSIEQTTCMLIQENIIELFDYRETLDGYRCAQCFRPNTTVVTRYLSKAGDVIVVSLNKYFGERLIEYPQNFTFENLMAGGRNDKYNLVATIEHNGSIDRGHYTARVERDGKYYQTNDLQVSILPEQQLPPLNTTYMLFYEIDDLQGQAEIRERKHQMRLEAIEQEHQRQIEDIEREQEQRRQRRRQEEQAEIKEREQAEIKEREQAEIKEREQQRRLEAIEQEREQLRQQQQLQRERRLELQREQSEIRERERQRRIEAIEQEREHRRLELEQLRREQAEIRERQLVQEQLQREQTELRERQRQIESIEQEHQRLQQQRQDLYRLIQESQFGPDRLEQEINRRIQNQHAPREVEEVYNNTLERLRSISYNKPMVNKMNWDKVLALKTSIGIFSEEAGQLTNFAESEDQPNQEYLDADRNNLIFMFPYGKKQYKAFGYTLDQILSTPNTNIIYECEKDEKGEYIRKKYNGVWGDGRIIPLDKKPKAYIKIPTESQVYVPAEELLGAIESGERVFLLYDPKNIKLSVSYGAARGGNRVSDTHCQEGSDKTIYSLKVYSQQRELLDQKIEQEKKDRERQAKIVEQEKKAKIGGGREDAGSTVQGVMGLMKIFGM